MEYLTHPAEPGVTHRPRVFTWHIHGSYLYYLSHAAIDLYIPFKADRAEGYYGRGETFPFGPNVIEVPAEEVSLLEFDCILFQSRQNYLVDQFEILSAAQRDLPKLYLEHNTPEEHPTDTKHVVDDPAIQLIHVTHFNRLMWDANRTPSRVIEHGVRVPDGIAYDGTLAKGVVVINNLPARGRLLGFDIFKDVRAQVPLDLVGMGTGAHGLGEVLHPDLSRFIAGYRFFFSPIRYTSLGLAVCEAMMLAIPVVALATTELATVIRNGENGYIHTDVDYLVDRMRYLIDNPLRARRMGEAGRRTAVERFNIRRFSQDWQSVIRLHLRDASVNGTRFLENAER